MAISADQRKVNHAVTSIKENISTIPAGKDKVKAIKNLATRELMRSNSLEARDALKLINSNDIEEAIKQMLAEELHEQNNQMEVSQAYQIIDSEVAQQGIEAILDAVFPTHAPRPASVQPTPSQAQNTQPNEKNAPEQPTTSQGGFSLFGSSRRSTSPIALEAARAKHAKKQWVREQKIHNKAVKKFENREKARMNKDKKSQRSFTEVQEDINDTLEAIRESVESYNPQAKSEKEIKENGLLKGNIKDFTSQLKEHVTTASEINADTTSEKNNKEQREFFKKMNGESKDLGKGMKAKGLKDEEESMKKITESIMKMINAIFAKLFKIGKRDQAKAQELGLAA